MYPSPLDNLIDESSSSQELFDENKSNSRKAHKSNEPVEENELALDCTNESDNGSEKQNIINLKGLPPPPPKPPRIFLSCDGHSNITLENIVNSNYEQKLYLKLDFETYRDTLRVLKMIWVIKHLNRLTLYAPTFLVYVSKEVGLDV